MFTKLTFFEVTFIAIQFVIININNIYNNCKIYKSLENED